MIGLELTESLSGSYYRLDDPVVDYALEVTLRIETSGLHRFIRDGHASAEGTIRAEGLAASAKATGTITWKLGTEKRIPYDLAFTGDDGKPYRLRGQRDFFVHDALLSLTLLPASLYDDTGKEIGRATLRFDPKTELVPTLKSLRPRLKL